jgi:hypothetical protein
MLHLGITKYFRGSATGAGESLPLDCPGVFHALPDVRRGFCILDIR